MLRESARLGTSLVASTDPLAPIPSSLCLSAAGAVAAAVVSGEDGSMSALPDDELRRLPVSRRLELVEALWDSIREDADDLPLTDAMRAELDRRLAAHEADPTAAQDADVVLERLRKR